MRTLAVLLVFLVGCTQAVSDTTMPSPAPVVDGSPSTTPPPPTVPDVVGMTRADAMTALGRGSFKSELTERPVPRHVGVVLDQKPGAGASSKRGMTVTITVGVPYPKVPHVAGVQLQTAKTLLRRAGLVPHVVMHGTTIELNKGVYAQNIAAGTQVHPSKTVTLQVWHNVCTRGYSPCLPLASDYDCAGGTGDGPRYTGVVRVTGFDPYWLDADNDGYGCNGV